jgi:hypothetical protein
LRYGLSDAVREYLDTKGYLKHTEDRPKQQQGCQTDGSHEGPGAKHCKDVEGHDCKGDRAARMFRRAVTARIVPAAMISEDGVVPTRAIAAVPTKTASASATTEKIMTCSATRSRSLLSRPRIAPSKVGISPMGPISMKRRSASRPSGNASSMASGPFLPAQKIVKPPSVL